MAEIQRLNGYDIKDKKALRYYENILDMITDSTLENGMGVETLGYFNSNDKHGAKYVISDQENNNIKQILLNNGLYANLISRDSNFRNTKCLAPVYGSLWINDNHTEQYIETTINKMYKAGFTGIVLLAHITASGEINETIEALNYAKDYAISKGLICDTLKFHYKFGTQAIYSQAVTTTLNLVKPIRTVYLYNESNDFIDNNLEIVNAFISTIKDLGYKVGISNDFGGINRLKIKEEYQNILSNLDIVGYNYYPRISIPGKNGNSNLSEKIWDSFAENNFKSIFEGKEFTLSETGILPFMEFLEQPSLYRIQDFPTSTPTPNAQKIYFYGLLKNINLNVVDKIFLWFTESFSDETYDYIASYIFNGGEE